MTNDEVETMATLAQQAGGGKGKGSSLMNFMLQRMMLGNKTPARSNKEGLGRFLAPLLVGMAAQGIQSWKNNYDARGRAKADADAIMERYRQTGQITDAERAELAKMRENYKDNPKYQGRWDIDTPPAQPAPQGGGQPPVQGDAQTPAPQISRETAWAAAQAMQPPAQAPAPELAGAFQEPTGEGLSDVAKQNLQEALQNMGRDKALEELLSDKTKEDFLGNIARSLGW